MIAVLRDNLKKYEQQYGDVVVAQQPAGENEIGFKALEDE